MTSRLKEEQRNEKTIRNLLKLPENRRCINCNSLGPQYVCTNFWTFVCTTCSGIHREFTHRVKSVSMAKFTSQEVSALQGGGNASAKEIYFKEWDPQLQSFPDSSNIERLRDFIKHVYVDKRYSGEKSFAPKVKMGEAEDSYQGGSRSPPFRPSPGGSPPAARSDIVNDWRRDDRFRDGRKSEDGKISDGGFKVEGKSPDSQRDPDMSSPPIVRPVRDILGEKVSPLWVIEPPKVNGPRPSNGSVHTQRTVSSSSLASSNGNPTELRTESSLIDFDAVPEPASSAQVAQIQQTAPSPAPLVTQPTTSSNNNWANFDSVQEVKASHAPSSTNLLDVLSELSVPVSNATPLAGPSGSTQVSPPGAMAPVSAPINHLTVTMGGAQAATPGPSNAFGQWQNVHSQQNLFPISQAFPQSVNQAVVGSQHNQQWNPSLSGNTQAPSSQSSESQVTHGVDVKPTIKKELPEDLFTFNYSSFAAPGPGWFPAPQYGTGFNMQYYVPQQPMPPAYLQPAKRSNPFDVNEPSPLQATAFPSMTPLQGALPNMVPQSGIIHRTSSLGVLSPSWMPTQSSSQPLPSTSNIQRTSSLGTPSSPWMQTPSSHQLSYGSAMSPGPFMGPAAPNMPPPPRPQAGGFGSFNPSQHQTGSSFSSLGGNPFG